MCKNKTSQNKEKTVYLEICRIIAIFCIMYQHTGGRGADAWRYTDSRWVYLMSLIGNIIGCIGVPIFLMISGALLLSKKESWKKIYGKRIPRIAGALIIFSAIRYFYQCIAGNQAGSVGEFLRQFYMQEIFIPYWFLYEYLGILLVLPFLKKMMQNLTDQEEKLLFFLILGWNLFNDISKICWGTGFALDLPFSNFLFYFILGYLIENCQMLRRSDRRGLWFCIGQAAFVIGGICIWMHGRHELEALACAVKESLLMLLTLSVYYVTRYVSEKIKLNSAVMHRFILWCGSHVFGIYLIEDYLRNATAAICDKLEPYIYSIPACCIWLLAVFLISNVLIAGLRKLPLLRKIL